MYQLSNMINRKLAQDNPEKHESCRRFFLLILHAHAIATANSSNHVSELAKEIIKKFKTRTDDTRVKSYEDEVYLYVTEVLSLSLIWNGFHDVEKEADGDRQNLMLLKVSIGNL